MERLRHRFHTDAFTSSTVLKNPQVVDRTVLFYAPKPAFHIDDSLR